MTATKKIEFAAVLAKCKELGGAYDGRGSWDMVYFPTAQARDTFAAWLRKNGRDVQNAKSRCPADGDEPERFTLQTR